VNARRTLPAAVLGAAVGEVHVTGLLVDVDAVGEVERRAAGVPRRHGLRQPAAPAHAHEPQVRVREVEVAGGAVELQAQRTPARDLRCHLLLLLRRALRHRPAMQEAQPRAGQGAGGVPIRQCV
jgi:hypothetical protein